MKYRQSLEIRLQERYRRLYKAAFQAYHNEIGYLVDFIRRTPALNVEVAALEEALPDLEAKAWADAHVRRQGVEWPPTEQGRAKVAWHLMNAWASEENAAAMFGHTINRDSSLQEGVRTATEQVVEPLIEYLQERLREASDMLYLLERYVRRVEWFEKKRLWDAYQADTARGESTYDGDLRRFLFEEGIDYPFSQPRSASGEADVVADLSGDDPLVCEVKLFAGGSYGKSYVGKGFRQAVQYAHDYGKTSAYLVVFNVSDKRLDLPTDGEPSSWPPRIETEGVTVYLVRVRAKPTWPQGVTATAPDQEVSEWVLHVAVRGCRTRCSARRSPPPPVVRRSGRRPRWRACRHPPCAGGWRRNLPPCCATARPAPVH